MNYVRILLKYNTYKQTNFCPLGFDFLAFHFVFVISPYSWDPENCPNGKVPTGKVPTGKLPTRKSAQILTSPRRQGFQGASTKNATRMGKWDEGCCRLKMMWMGFEGEEGGYSRSETWKRYFEGIFIRKHEKKELFAPVNTDSWIPWNISDQSCNFIFLLHINVLLVSLIWLALH